MRSIVGSNDAGRWAPAVRGVVVGTLAAAPAAAVPAVQIPLILWTRRAYEALHPLGDHPDTVSRAISDAPAVGDVFANGVILVGALITLALWRIISAYRVTIDLRLARASRAHARSSVGVTIAGVSQCIAIAGMILASQFTLADNHDLHMLGSYVFFAGQVLTISISGLICAVLARSPQRIDPARAPAPLLLPGMSSFRAWFALAIFVQAILYLALFFLKNMPFGATAELIRVCYVYLEVVVLSSFVLYLGSFAPDLYRIGCRRHGVARET